MNQISIYGNDIKDPEQRTAIQSLIGRPLQEGEQLAVFVFRPGVEPSPEAKRQALAGIEAQNEAIRKHGEAIGVTEDEVEAAIEEAIRETRKLG